MNLKKIVLLCGVIMVCSGAFAGPNLEPDDAKRLIEGEVLTIDDIRYVASYEYDCDQALGFEYNVEKIVEVPSKDASFKYKISCIDVMQDQVNLILTVVIKED